MYKYQARHTSKIIVSLGVHSAAATLAFNKMLKTLQKLELQSVKFGTTLSKFKIVSKYKDG
jgi:hypothetical protein